MKKNFFCRKFMNNVKEMKKYILVIKMHLTSNNKQNCTFFQQENLHKKFTSCYGACHGMTYM